MTFLVIDIGEEDYWVWIQNNWKTIRCAEMTGPALAFEAARAIRRFDGTPQAIWPSVVSGLLTGAEFVGCILSEDDIAEIFPETDVECQAVRYGGQLIARIDGGLGAVALQPFGGMQGAKEILNAGYTPGGNAFCKYKSPNEGEFTETVIRQEVYEKFDVRWYIRPAPGDGCIESPLIPLPDPDPPPPFEFQEPTDGDCLNDDAEAIPSYGKVYEIRLVDSALDARGILWNKYRIYVARYVNPECRGRPSVDFRYQCYWESSMGVIWVDCDQVGLPFQGYVERPNCNPGLSAVTYKVSAGCTWNEEEGRYDTVYEAPVDGTDNGVLGLAWRLDALAWLLEKVNLIPYGICGTQEPEEEGDWVTAQWISDESSPDSTLRLRKRTRWRSKSGRTDSELAEYFRDFEWDAGPVCVRHTGAWWGNPQVWASTVDEGKRVITEIAREAGLDPDVDGQWKASVARNPRFGMTGKMRLRRIEGIPWISSRDGSDMLPMG